MKRPRRVMLIGLPVAVALAGCSLASQGPYTGTVSHPTGSEVVLRVEWTGGFVPYEHLFTSLPRFTLLGDGRVIVEGPQIEIYPGPALPNLQVRRLTEEGIQSVLFRVAETGLFDESHSFSAASQFIADANTTVFTLHANDAEVVVDIYALGILVDLGGSPMDVPDDELAAHDTLATLDGELQNLDSWIPADDWADPSWQSYEAEAYRLLVTNIDSRPPNPDGLDSDPVPWPGAVAPDDFGTASTVQDFRCGVVSGEDATTWTAALQQANVLTRWSDDGHLYSVTARPLLPDEPLDCGDALS